MESNRGHCRLRDLHYDGFKLIIRHITATISLLIRIIGVLDGFLKSCLSGSSDNRPLLDLASGCCNFAMGMSIV